MVQDDSNRRGLNRRCISILTIRLVRSKKCSWFESHRLLNSDSPTCEVRHAWTGRQFDFQQTAKTLAYSIQHTAQQLRSNVLEVLPKVLFISTTLFGNGLYVNQDGAVK